MIKPPVQILLHKMGFVTVALSTSASIKFKFSVYGMRRVRNSLRHV